MRKLLFNRLLSRSAFNAQDSHIRTSVQVIGMRLHQVTACYEIVVSKPISRNRYLDKPGVVRLVQKFPTLNGAMVTGSSPLFGSTFESHLASRPYFPTDRVLIVLLNHSSASDTLCRKTVQPHLHCAIAHVAIRNFWRDAQLIQCGAPSSLYSCS